MRDFFRGWKRKVGVVTLGSASVFAMAWCRSQFENDSIQIPHGHCLSILRLAEGTLGWSCIWSTAEYDLSKDFQFSWITLDLEEPFTIDAKDESLLQRLCFDYQDKNRPHNLRTRRLVIPFWSIVIPLTLLSAYLLLSRRNSVPMKAAEPVLVEGA